MTPPLPFAEFRFSIRVQEPLCLPAQNKGNVLRGAFGTMLRRLCCHPGCPGATRCQLRATCPYARIFEPGPPPGSTALSNYEAIPRPFVFRPPLDERTRYAPDEALQFGLVLVGLAIDFLPYFVLAFERLCEEGFGLNRARCLLERVEQMPPPSAFFILQPYPALSTRHSAIPDRLLPSAGPAQAHLIFDAASRVMHQPIPRSQPLTCNLPPATSLLVRFLTPTHLVFGEKTVREPEFHHLVRRLRDRINALATFYGDGPLDLDFKGLGERAEAVRCARRDLRWEKRPRTSSRSGRRHDVGGFTGECLFEAPSLDALGEFVPLVWLGQYLHVGKHTPWGNGWLQVEL